MSMTPENKVLRTIGRVVAGLMAALCLLVCLLQSAPVQTALARSLTKNIDGTDLKVTVGSVHLVPFRTVIVKDLVLIDKDPYLEDPYGRGYEHRDTLLRAGRLSATFTLKGLKNGLELSRVTLKDTDYSLQIQEWGKDKRTVIGTFSKALHLPAESDTNVAVTGQFKVQRVRVENFHFRMSTFSHPMPAYNGKGINWGDLNVVLEELKAHSVECRDGKICVCMDYAQAREANGYAFSSCGAYVEYMKDTIRVQNFQYSDGQSDIFIPHYEMIYDNPYDFADFTRDVHMNATLEHTKLNLNTVFMLIGNMDSTDVNLYVDKARACGPADSLYFHEFKVREVHGASVDATGSVTNMTREGQLEFDINLNKVGFTTEELGGLLGTFAGLQEVSSQITEFGKGEEFVLSGNALGNLNNIKGKLSLAMGDGALSTDIYLGHLIDNHTTVFRGSADIDNFHLGKLLCTEVLGPSSAHLEASGKLGETPYIGIRTLNIKKLTALDYAYRGIAGNGVFSGTRFNGKIVSKDPNLNFLFQGIYDFSEKTNDRLYKFFATIPYANLHALNLDKSREVSLLTGCKINVNLRSMNDAKALVGECGVKGLQFTDANGKHDIGNVLISGHIKSGLYRVSINSDFINGGYVSDRGFKAIAQDIMACSTGKFIPAIRSDDAQPYSGGKFDMDLKIGGIQGLLSLIDPKLYIAEGTGISGNMTSDGIMSLKVESPRLAYGNSFIKDLAIRASSLGDTLSVLAQSTGAKFSGLNLGNLDASAGIASQAKDADSIAIDIHYMDISLGEDLAHIGLSLDGQATILGAMSGISLNLGSYDPDGNKILSVNGNCDLKNNSIDAKALLTSFDIGIAQALTGGVLSKLEGKINGDINICGSLDNPSIMSYKGLRLSNGYATVGLTGVSYGLDAYLSFKDNNLEISNVSLKDPDGGSAVASGTLQDLRMAIDNLKIVSKKDDGSAVSGDLAINGNVSLKSGADSPLLIDAAIKTASEGKVNINAGGSAQNASASILTFKDSKRKLSEEELYKERVSKLDQEFKSKFDYDIKALLDVSPNVQLKLSLDNEGINTLSAQGRGLVNLEMNSSSPDVNLSGSYNISSGRYHLALLGALVNKDFTIEEGSSLKFGGDLMDTEFDINAIHSLRASLGPLISDTSSVSAQRTINCGLKVTSKLSSPELAFDIEVPDLDPSTSAKVQSELNTEDKIQRQFVALLVTGSFIPIEQGGIVNNTTSNILYNNLSQIMSGQLNSILQKLEIPLDMGLNYKQNEAGKDIFDVAISTQMFNNRVIVNGSIGNRQYSTSSSDDMVGDVDVEIKLNRTGTTRLTLFSHSADAYSNFLDNSQRSGVGISYQKEFRTLKDLFTKKKNE